MVDLFGGSRPEELMEIDVEINLFIPKDPDMS